MQEVNLRFECDHDQAGVTGSERESSIILRDFRISKMSLIYIFKL